MKDLHHPCELWAEPVSLAAAGCLSPDEERNVRQHMEKCAGCRERFQQLSRLCDSLAAARSSADGAESRIVERAMSVVTDDESRQHGVRAGTEALHPTLLIRSLDTWRRIMRSPVSRVSAAAVLVFAITGMVVWLHSGGTTPAFADFIAPILEAKNATYKITTEIKGPPATTITGNVMVLGATRSRHEMAMPNKSRAITIFDWGQGKSLTLDPTTKKAMIVSLANLTKAQVSQQDPFAWFRSILLDVRDKPDVHRESLGEMEIGGRRVVGYRATSKGMVVDLWGDPRTGLPVRAEMSAAMYANVKSTMSDFVFNVDMDESLFSLEPPPGYTVQNMQVDVSTATEKDLIAMFREYSELTGGRFPESLDMQTMLLTAGKLIGMRSGMQVLRERLAASNVKLSPEQLREVEELMRKLMDRQLLSGQDTPSQEEIEKTEGRLRTMVKDAEKHASGQGTPDKEQMRKATQAEVRRITEANMKTLLKVQIPLQRGVLFVLSLPAKTDAHYAGRGVSFDAANTPIFWYRPEDAKTYRVVWADLSVRDAETPPVAPNAQRVGLPAPPQN